ncbi:hypothetical protein RRF57_011053 [Xylaria bambusicola]|uniref:Uncharacterized protein n=1 Tax=Xylaria bambusicola TaxID=326684 RepID=A0AAN7UY00_9PEZI
MTDDGSQLQQAEPETWGISSNWQTSKGKCHVNMFPTHARVGLVPPLGLAVEALGRRAMAVEPEEREREEEVRFDKMPTSRWDGWGTSTYLPE